MYTVSLEKKVLHVIIHNQYLNLELTSLVYFSDGTTCYISPSQQANTETIMEASFEIDPKQKDFKGALLYKLQRESVTIIDNHPDSSITSIENTETNMYFLVAWEVKDMDRNFYTCLIECTDDFTWDEDKLWALYKEYNNQFHENYESTIATWLIHDDAVMKTRREMTIGSVYKLDIFISEEPGKGFMFKPIEIDPKRLVLSLPVTIALIYAVRLRIQPSVKLNIHNQCLNIDFVSPTYATDSDSECHRLPYRNVCAGDTKRSSYIVKSEDDGSGALIYKLQRKRMHESTDIVEDTSSGIYLLVNPRRYVQMCCW
jgi:hypothetical protein